MFFTDKLPERARASARAREREREKERFMRVCAYNERLHDVCKSNCTPGRKSSEEGMQESMHSVRYMIRECMHVLDV